MHIKLRVKRIEIPAVQFILGNPQALPKPLVMDHLARPQELNRLAYVIVLNNTEDVVMVLLAFCSAARSS